MQSTTVTNNVNVNDNGIHCKVATHDTVRRFYAKNTDYNALLDQICTIFGFSKDSVVIKYIDDEGDLVTISSDPELKFAIDLAPRVLKLKVELIKPVGPVATDCEMRRMCNKKWRRRSSERFEGKRHCHEKHQRRAEKWAMKKPERLQMKLTWLKAKQEKLQGKLAALEANSASSPDSAPRLEKIRTKLAFISSKIEWLEQSARDHQASVAAGTEPSSACPTEGTEPSPATSSDVPQLDELTDSSESESLKDEPKGNCEEIHQRAIALRMALRQAQLQLQLQRTNFRAFVSQKPAQPDEQFRATVEQMKANLETAKKDVRAKKEELRELMGQIGKTRKCAKKCRKHQKGGDSVAPENEEEFSDPRFHHFGHGWPARGGFHGHRGGFHGPHGFHHGPHGYGPHFHGHHGFQHGPHHFGPRPDAESFGCPRRSPSHQ